MTLYQFNLLDELEQWEAVCNETPIANRSDKDFRYELYSINDFYVEVRYTMPDDLRTGLRSFRTTTLLGPYLGLINIDELDLKL